jgi:hypothetical protein
MEEELKNQQQQDKPTLVDIMETYYRGEFMQNKLNPKTDSSELSYLDEAIELAKKELSKVKPNVRLETINLYGKEISLTDLKIYHMTHNSDDYHRIRRTTGNIPLGVLLYKFERNEFNDCLRKIFGETHG